MPHTNQRHLATLAITLLLTACGQTGDPDPQDEARDASAEVDADAGGDDVSAPDGRDAGGAPDAATQDAGGCDPVEMADRIYGEHATVASAEATFEEVGDGYQATVDASLGGIEASADSSFVYVDLETASVLPLSDADARTDRDWDLAFKRSVIRLNSADSGPGGLMIARADDVSWEDATPPGRDAQWRTDDFIGEDCVLATYGRGTPDTAFAQWYDYDPATSTVSAPERTVYFMYDLSTHQVTKLAITGYADGVYTIRWG